MECLWYCPVLIGSVDITCGRGEKGRDTSTVGGMASIATYILAVFHGNMAKNRSFNLISGVLTTTTTN